MQKLIRKKFPCCSSLDQREPGRLLMTSTAPPQQPENHSSRHAIKNFLTCFGLAAIAVGLNGTAMAGEHFYNFDPPNGNPDAAAGFVLFGTQKAVAWHTNNGATGGDTDGFLEITSAGGNENLGVLFPLDYFTNGDGSLVALPLKGFLLEADVRIGNPVGPRPADGFSISFARSDDPVVFWGKQGQFRGWAGGDSIAEALEPTTFNFATGVGTIDENQCTATTAENGTKTGVSVQFDTWSGNTIVNESGLVPATANDNVGWRVHFSGKMLERIQAQPPTGPLPTTQTPDPTGADISGVAVCPPIVGAANAFDQDPTCTPLVCADTNTIETGVYTFDSAGDVSNLCWAHLSVYLDTNTPHTLTVTYKGRKLVDAEVLTNFIPYVGQIIMGGRTGGANENRDIDNVHVITYPSVQAVVGGISSVSGFVDDFTIGINNIGPAKVTQITKLALDGVDILANSDTHITIGDPATTVKYVISNPANLYTQGSGHSISITFVDAIGNTITTPLSFTTGTWSSLAGMAVPAASVDTTKGGFNVVTYQTTLGPLLHPTVKLNATVGTSENRVMDNSVRRGWEQLAGLLGPNSSATPNSVETGVINYDNDANGLAVGGFTGDYTQATDTNSANHFAQFDFPGIPDAPGGDPTTDNLALDVSGVLNFPDVGYYTITIDSDDGFALYFGNPANDVFHSTKVLEYNGGKGPSDISTTLYVPTNGYYPYHLVYYNGGGGALLEFICKETSPNPSALPFQQIGNLVNDPTTPSIKSYQGTTAPFSAAVTFITPMPNESSYAPNVSVNANITDGSDGAIKSGSVALWVNGTSVAATISKSGVVTSLAYTPPVNAPYPNGSNWLQIAFTDASNKAQTNIVAFNTIGYVTIPASMALPASVVNTSKSGFNVFGAQSVPHGPGDANTGNGNFQTSIYVGELEMHNVPGTTTPYMGWPNEIDAASFTGPGGSYIEAPGDAVGGVINYDGATGPDGDFADNGGHTAPGIPTLDNTVTNTDSTAANMMNYAYDIQTVLDLQPGFYQMGVSSDDGFCLTFGNPTEWKTLKLTVVQADFGKGASDVTGHFYISKAGLYPACVLYFEGGGGNNIEWYMQNTYPDNNWHALVNDSTATTTNFSGATVTPAMKAYQYPVGATKGSPYISSYKPAAAHGSSGESIDAATHTGYDSPVAVTLEDGETAVDTGTVKLWVDGTQVAPTVTKTGTTTKINYAPASNWTVNTNHSITLAFLDRTVSWTFQVENHPTATFFIEAEDFNFGGGQTVDAASTMPYFGGAYAGKTAVHGVDYFRSGNDNHGAWYRLFPNAGQVPVPFQVNHDLDRGANELVANQRIGWVGSVQWYNYTRTFPTSAIKYNVYAGLSQGNGAGTTPHARYGVLQVLDSPTSPTVTNSIGVFDDVATGAYGQNGGVGKGAGLAPLTDGNGNMVAVNFSGTQTLRVYFPASGQTLTVNGNTITTQGGSGDFDFLMFVPAATLPINPIISVGKVNGNVVITYTGTLQSSSTVNGNYAPVSGATSPYTVPNTGTPGAAFYRAH